MGNYLENNPIISLSPRLRVVPTGGSACLPVGRGEGEGEHIMSTPRQSSPIKGEDNIRQFSLLEGDEPIVNNCYGTEFLVYNENITICDILGASNGGKNSAEGESGIRFQREK